jgi:MFS family permease
MSGSIETAIGRKVLQRLVAPAALFILMGSIDRSNIGVGAIQMNPALGLKEGAYGFGAGVLFIGYLLAKYPSVLLYERVGMRVWLAVISIAWGLLASSVSQVQDGNQLYALRILIGFAEGGLSSGLMIYLSHWASERYRASVLAIPIMAVPIAQVLGSPISGWLMQADNPLGWPGWRWMFFIEGLPAIALGIFAFFWFPNAPSEAGWLTEEEKRWMAENIHGASARKGKQGGSLQARWSALANPTFWVCSLIWFCLLSGSYGVMFWLPTIVKGLAGLTPMETGVVVALPWLGNALGLFLNARHSDATQERYLHVAIPLGIAAAGLLSAYLIGPGVIGLLVLIVAHMCLGSTMSPFWAIPTKLLPPAAVAMGIVSINIVGSFAGLLVPTWMGQLKESTGSFLPPTIMLAGILLAGAALCLLAKGLERRRSPAMAPPVSAP